jgi:hypothetical protein
MGDGRARDLGRPLDLAHDEMRLAPPSVGTEPHARGAPHSRHSRQGDPLKLLSTTVLMFGSWAAAMGAHADDEQRIQALEAQLRAAQARIGELENTLTKMAADLAAIKTQPNADAEQQGSARTAPDAAESDPADEQRTAILAPDLGDDERDHGITLRPELFLQTGYAADPIDGATPDDAVTRFSVYRLEARWAGRVAERLGMGVEFQYQPAAEGASEELINDAFVEYYASDVLTLRVGQFVKPFGFDVQQSSSERESPERAIVAGYFFPGQRDRGAMVAADLGKAAEWLEGVAVYGGVFNGNRFFDDNNDALNVDVRVRKQFAARPFAIGASWEHGSQLLPLGSAGSNRSSVYGIDAQWVFGRLGIRAEYVRGDMPSTLLALTPEFAPGFTPGEKTSGSAAFFDYRLTSRDQVYWRWDQLANDPVTRANVHAFNVGYLRQIGESSRIGFDYQRKDDVTFNDDELNTHFSIRWNILLN